MTARVSKVAPKTTGERFILIESKIEGIQDKIDELEGSIKNDIGELKKSINGMGVRFDDARKTTQNRWMAFLTPVLSSITTGLLVGMLALIYGNKTIGQ